MGVVYCLHTWHVPYEALHICLALTSEKCSNGFCQDHCAEQCVQHAIKAERQASRVPFQITHGLLP